MHLQYFTLLVGTLHFQFDMVHTVYKRKLFHNIIAHNIIEVQYD